MLSLTISLSKVDYTTESVINYMEIFLSKKTTFIRPCLDLSLRPVTELM